MLNLISKNDVTVNTFTGEAFISQTKLAVMCGVSQQSISKRIKTDSSCSYITNENNQLDAKSAYLVVAHYATQGNAEAIQTIAKIGEAGMKAYLYHEAGYAISATKADVQMPQADIAFQRAALLTQMCINNLNLPQSGQLKLMADLGKQFGVPTQFLPSYGIDAPPQAVITTGSSVPTFSLTTGLKDYDMSAKTANQILIGLGILEVRTRPSTKAGAKTFKAFTEAGLKYGKNITSPNNPREVQPHFYVDTFPIILALLGL